MSKSVLDHKRQTDVSVQVWNLRRLPDGFSEEKNPGRLFVAVNGHWRGFFRLWPLLCNPQDPACPYTLPFSPASWTSILSHRAPLPNRAMGYTQELPPVDVIHTSSRISTETTKWNNEINELIALVEREEERE